MEFAIIAIIVVVGFGIRSGRRMFQMNKDVAQQQLAGLLAGAGKGQISPSDICIFMGMQGWTTKDVGTRIPHALSITKFIVTAEEYRFAVIVGKCISGTYTPNGNPDADSKRGLGQSSSTRPVMTERKQGRIEPIF